MVGAAIRYPASYKQLIGAGYADSQIPVWIARPDGSSSPEEGAAEAAEAPVELEDAPPIGEAVPIELLTLGDLQEPVETPSHRTVELEEPEAPIGEEVPIGAAKVPIGGEVPRGTGEELRQVYQQDLALERDLRRQNIVQLADGRHIQARPDGAGGVELVPVDASQLERMRTDVGSTISRITSRSLEVQMKQSQ